MNFREIIYVILTSTELKDCETVNTLDIHERQKKIFIHDLKMKNYLAFEKVRDDIVWIKSTQHFVDFRLSSKFKVLYFISKQFETKQDLFSEINIKLKV